MTFKKIYSLFALAIVAAGLVACSDDDAGSEYLRQSQVSIESSTVTFNARAGKGSVVFSAPEGTTPTATVSSSWATAQVDGDTVRIAVENNPNLEGRSALLTIKAGQDSTNVTIQQQGMAYKYLGDNYYVFNDSARSLTLPLNNEGGVMSVEAPDGVSAAFNDSTLSLSLSENNTGSIRNNDVILHDGPYTDTIQVVQGELKDIINRNYKFVAYDLAQNKQSNNIEDYQVDYDVMVLADTIYHGGKTYVIPCIYFPDENWAISFDFDEQNLISEIPGGIIMGTYGKKYYLYTAIVDLSVYSSLVKSNEAFPALMASEYMSMYGLWGYDTKAGTFSLPEVNPKNLKNWMGQLFDNLTSYKGNTLGVFAFNSKMGDWVDDDGKLNVENISKYAGPLSLFVYPALMENASSDAKPAMLPLMRRPGNRAEMMSELSKQLQIIKAVKAEGAMHSGNMKLNTSARFSSPSAYDYLRMLNVSLRK